MNNTKEKNELTKAVNGVYKAITHFAILKIGYNTQDFDTVFDSYKDRINTYMRKTYPTTLSMILKIESYESVEVAVVEMGNAVVAAV